MMKYQQDMSIVIYLAKRHSTVARSAAILKKQASTSA